MKDSSRRIQSVARAFQILELLAAAPEGESLSRIAAALGLHPQTAQSLLRTLESLDMVTQAGRGAPYLVGPGVHRLSRRWMAGRGLVTLAEAPVQALSRQIGEYVLLAELRGNALVHLVQARARQLLAIHPESELQTPIHAMATGKLLLAYLDDAARERILAGLDLKQVGPRTVTDVETLRRQLAQIRRQGYVVCIEENGEGVAAMAVPVHGPDGVVVAALGVAVPLVRFPARRRETLRAQIHEGAQHLEGLLRGET